MTITADTRACSGCGRLVHADEPACLSCGRVVCPLLAEWPKDLKKFLSMRALVGKVESIPTALPQQKWEFILMSTMRFRHWPHAGIIPMSATTTDCYVAAITEMNAWLAQGARVAL